MLRRTHAQFGFGITFLAVCVIAAAVHGQEAESHDIGCTSIIDQCGCGVTNSCCSSGGLFGKRCGSDPCCCESSCQMDACCSDPCCGGCGGRFPTLGKILHPSDHCFDDFISPMSNFIFFEDPRTLTEARAIFFHHELPSSVGSLGLPGGRVQLYAVQLRFALSERLSIIATKDGYIVSDMIGGPLATLLNDGWADVTAGLKYNFYRDTVNGQLISAGLTYELPVGSTRALQDIGTGEFYGFISGGSRLWGGLGHYIGTVGYRAPANRNVQTQSFHWSNHFDVKLTEKTYLFTDVVWWHWTKSARVGLPLGVAGHDAFNLSSTNVTGNDLVTQSVGFKYKPSGNTEMGVAYEFPLTKRKDITDYRIQAELILRY